MILAGRRVLDIADGIGLYCTKILAEFGADVIKVERPEGDATRRLPPFNGDVPHPERSLTFLYYNLNKRGITLNIETADGRELFKQLVKTADILVESLQPGYLEQLGLGCITLKEVNPGLIMTSITGFGQTGPYSNYKAPDIVGFAMGGPMFLSGRPDKPPVTAPGNLAYVAASAYAMVGTLVALHNRMRTGLGQHVDVSMQEAVTFLADNTIPQYSHEGIVVKRQGHGTGLAAPWEVYPCKYGFVEMCIVTSLQWRGLMDMIGRPEVLADPVWEALSVRAANAEVIDPYIKEYTLQHTKAEIYKEAGERHLPIAPVNSPAEFVESPHSKDRNLFVELEHPEVGTQRYFGGAFRFSGAKTGPQRPAPLLGQHNEDIYCGELGLSEGELAALRHAGVI